MRAGRRYILIVGLLALLGLPVSWKLASSRDGGEAGNRAAEGPPPAHAVGGGEHGGESRGSRGSPPSLAPTGGAEQRATAVLAEYELFQLLDLSVWQGIDTLAYHTTADELGLAAADMDNLLAAIGNVRSKRMQQAVLALVGLLGPTDVDALIPHLEDGALRAAAAYAIGRVGTARAVTVLREWLQRADLSADDRDAIYYGLAQAGPGTIADLVAATEARLRDGVERLDQLPLGWVRSAAARRELEQVALRHEDPRVRAAAIRGFVDASRGEVSEAAWLAAIAGAGTDDRAVRIEALRGLETLAPDESAKLIQALLAEPDPPPILLDFLQARLDEWPRSGGYSREDVDRLLRMTGDASDAAAREVALRTVASLGPVAEKRLAELLPTLDIENRALVLAELTQHGERLGAELLDAIAAALPGAGAEETFAALEVLSLSESHREVAARIAWERYLAAGDDTHGRYRTLVEVAPYLGARGSQEIMRAFGQADEFIPRIELVSALVGSDNDEAEVTDFVRREVMPFLRAKLQTETGAWIAYSGIPDVPVNALADTIVNAFGRFGDEADVAILQSLGPAFLRDQRAWPDNLKTTIHRELTEATARAIDLIRLRSAR